MKVNKQAGSVGRRARREFRAEAVRMVAERRAVGVGLTPVGRELDVRPEQRRAWARLARDVGNDSRMAGETVEQENRRLRREVAVLRREQAFAKKVLRFVADDVPRPVAGLHVEDLTQYCSVRVFYAILRSPSFRSESWREPKRYWEQAHV